MRLLSATVRNYRLHQEISVAFDPSRTLIGGPNEAGKSTLIEAVHRGLFLKSTVTGEAQRSMVSTRFSGHPEVEIRFTARGGEYHLSKRFSGPSGTTRLMQTGGETWHGEDAELQLARLLGVEETAGGRGILDRIARRWAHLWVWQGSSGDDPAVHAAAQQEELIQQLQDAGGAVAMQSELDGRVAAQCNRARELLFTRDGNAKRHSDLDRAQSELRDATAEHDAAAERLARLERAITEFEQAESTTDRTTSELEALRGLRRQLATRIAETERLQQIEREQAMSVDGVRERLLALEAVEESIRALQESMAAVEMALQPKRENLAGVEEDLAGRRRRMADAERALEEAQAAARTTRLRRDIAAAQVTVHETRAACAEAGKRLRRVNDLQGVVETHRRGLVELPSIDEDRLARLRAFETGLGEAGAALQAMAAEVEVLSADQPVRIGNEEIPVGGSRVIAEAADLHIGEAIRLRIHPGGGHSLEQARDRVQTMRDQLQDALDSHGIESVERAAAIVAARSDLQRKTDAALAALEELDPAGTEQALRAAEEDLARAEADLARRLGQVEDAQVPATLPDARKMQNELDDVLREAEEHENSLRAARDVWRQEIAALEAALSSLREHIAADQHALTGFEAQRRLLLDNHGDDVSRHKALADARAELARAASALDDTRKALRDIQPALLDADRERLERSVEETNRRLQDARTTMAVNQNILRSDGKHDPTASFAQAKARMASAQEHLQMVTRKAMAIARLDDLFHEQQQALADRFSQPLADRITEYLQCLFGPDVSAVVRFEDNAFRRIHLVRSTQTGATEFDVLSAGTREQVAAAVRLAIAELLATAHDGTLPVVFDDAFAYSDPERVQSLQRMLDRGATRGLQLIVATCNPFDYAALGARRITLKPAPVAHPTSSTLPIEPDHERPAAESPPDPMPAAPQTTGPDPAAFLAALQTLGRSAGNAALRRHLGWTEQDYNGVKHDLLAQGRILPGRGRGGSVRLPE